MKKILFLFGVFCSGCMIEPTTIDSYVLEKYNGSEIPVCIEYQQEAEIVKDGYWETDSCGNDVYVPDKYEVLKDKCSKKTARVVPYDYCLSRLPKPIFLVEKKIGEMTICYDRNNKVELPILYCQKDMINIQTTEVQTNVFQQTRIKTVLN